MKNKRILYIGNKLALHGRTPTNIDVLGPLLEQEGYTVDYSSSKLNKWRRLAEMLRTIKQRQHDVDVVLIDTYSTLAFFYAWLCARLCKRSGLKYIPVLHGGNLPERVKNSPKMSKSLFGNSFMNVAVSGYLHEAMQHYGYKSTIIENSIVLSEYIFRQRSVIRPKLLWVRAFHRTYNPKMAVEVVHLLKEKYPDVHLTMVGPDLDGSMKKCKRLTEEKGLQQHISFTGKLSKSEWRELAEEADIFINTTNYDNLPVSLLEAMALGLPVITTNVGGIPYLVTHEQTGLLTDQEDAYDMYQAIVRSLKDKDLVERLSTNGRHHAEQFGWDIISKKWETLLAKL